MVKMNRKLIKFKSKIKKKIDQISLKNKLKKQKPSSFKEYSNQNKVYRILNLELKNKEEANQENKET